MKYLFLTFFISYSILSVNGQNNIATSDSTQNKEAYPDLAYIVYKNAMLLNDLEIATYALHNIVASNPNGGIYKDTLALVYLQRSKFIQAKALTNITYQEKETDFRNEVLAICAKNLNQPTEAIEYYKKLYKSNRNSVYLFELSQLEYSMKRLIEAKHSVEELLSSLTSDENSLVYVPTDDKTMSQKVRLQAAANYLLGNVYFELGDYKGALTMYEKALLINPDYKNALKAKIYTYEKVYPKVKK
jgi:tetratricopeptide (TPR) repeat protein